MQEFLAREYENNKQTLKEHLTNVSDLASEFSKYKSISKLTGLLHDVGKASSEFQTYLLSKNHKRGDVVHALQGTFYLDSIIGGSDDLASMMLKEILSLSITAHHGSLSDGISPDGEKVFLHKLKNKNDERYHYSEIEQNIKENLEEVIAEINHLIESANKEIDTILDLLKRTYNTGKSAQFAMGLFVKYIYSCLIDADRYDAYLFEIDKKAESTKPNWENFINIFEENINKYNNDTQIAKIRQSISNQCKDAANKNSGIYRLSVSTGGGKTLSSFRFALHHCKEKKKSRIIYVIPYLSIIEQTASELHKILNLDEENDFILEHHSGIVPSDDSEEQKIKKLAASRWNNPLIITTMVQFLETIMSAKGSKLRKFHHMSDSVIIFDEIQSLPVKTIHLFNEAVSFLAKVCNSTILLCTATQPQLHKTEKNNLLLESDSNLIDCDHLFADIKRTIIKKETDRNADDFSDFIIDKANVNGNCLAIVNTKKSAKEVYDRVKRQQDFAVYHLSTSMCSVHRTLILNKIKDDLKHQRKIICITTPLIEAGVDVSFACVIRATAGLDSVAQAAGRCNRNGESDEPKEVYVVSLTDENLTKLADIEAGKNI
ncbi:MAG: CRISPR-associated helicase Cas3', partial [Lachnospiraceae bacterium]|nr:CRISPR-associated helicase Cas3' [Lachnospiraceae bacterium]